jgi:hypothetical protein
MFSLAAVPERTADEWQAIPSDQLSIKEDHFDPGAKAIILYREIVDDDVKKVESTHYRIKVLTDSGRSYGDVEIPYFEKKSSIEKIRARVVEPDGRVLDFNGQIFDKLAIKAQKRRVQVKTFSLPEVHAGSIVEYSYLTRWKSKTPDVLENPGMYVITGTDAVTAARWVVPEELSIRLSKFTLVPLPHAQVVWTSNLYTSKNGPTRQPDGNYVMELENLPGLPHEEFMPPLEWLKARVDFFYVLGRLYDASDFWSSYSNSLAEGLEKSWSKSKSLQEVVEATVSPADSPEERLRKLYDRAQHFHYETQKNQQFDDESFRLSNNLSELLKRGYGVGNQINLLFVAMVRAAGFRAAPVWVTDRRKGFFRPNSMDAGQLSAMVTWVQIGPKEYYLDPADRYCPFNLLPWFEESTRGYRVEKSGGVFVTTPNSESGRAVLERKGSLQLDDQGILSGHIRATFSGQEALDRRSAASDQDDAARWKTLVDEAKGWLPSGSTADLVAHGTWEQAAEPLWAEFTIKIPNYGNKAGHRLLIPTGVFGNEKPVFQSAARRSPIYFPYPHQQLDEIELQLPDDYRVESVPEPRKQSTQFGHYEISSCKDHNLLQIKRKMVTEGFFFPTEDYPKLKAFYDTVRSNDEQQIILQIPTAMANARPIN